MMRRSSTPWILVAVVSFILSMVVHAQLPGPPVGAPQSKQNAAYGYNFEYPFTPSAATGAGFRVAPTINTTTATSMVVDGVAVASTVVLPNSSATATTVTAMRILAPVLTLNSGSATNQANVKIEAAGTGATNNYSLWVVGAARFDAQTTLTNPNIQQTFTASASATPTLTQAQCGGMFAMDRASGTNYTLPTPIVGCTFDFLYTVTQTSGTNEVQTSAGTVFIQGAPLVTGTTTAGFACNGTSHIAIKSNDTTTGGLLGGHVRFTALTALLWDLQGVLVGSGSVATPCSTTT